LKFSKVFDVAFVMVLSYSRQIFLRFFLDARMESFLRGHVAAFTAWNGCALSSHPDRVRRTLSL
jgi:transposase